MDIGAFLTGIYDGVIYIITAVFEACKAVADCIGTITTYFSTFPAKISASVIAILTVVIALRVAGRD